MDAIQNLNYYENQPIKSNNEGTVGLSEGNGTITIKY